MSLYTWLIVPNNIDHGVRKILGCSTNGSTIALSWSSSFNSVSFFFFIIIKKRKYQLRVDLVEMSNFVAFFVLMSVTVRPIWL